VNYRELQAVLIRAVQRNLPIPRKPLSWQLKRHDRLLQSPSSFEVALTGVEVCLLETMLRQPGKTASRRELIEAMGHDFLTFDERRIEVRISRLRKKIRDSTSNEDPLQSEWGVGYAFAAPCEIV
jgi:DNA-binding response OmpR family regulator